MNELWTAEDVVNGDCSVLDVGTPKPITQDSSSPTTEELNMVALIRDAFNHVGGTEQFKREAAKNPGELYRTMLKMGVAQVAKETPATLPDLDALSEEDMLSLPTATLKLILLKSVGVTRKSEIGAI